MIVCVTHSVELIGVSPGQTRRKQQAKSACRRAVGKHKDPIGLALSYRRPKGTQLVGIFAPMSGIGVFGQGQDLVQKVFVHPLQHLPNGSLFRFRPINALCDPNVDGRSVGLLSCFQYLVGADHFGFPHIYAYKILPRIFAFGCSAGTGSAISAAATVAACTGDTSWKDIGYCHDDLDPYAESYLRV